MHRLRFLSQFFYQHSIFAEGNFTSLPELIRNSINSCPIDVKETVMGNIIITGGLSNVTNFAEILNDHLTKIGNQKNFRKSILKFKNLENQKNNKDICVQTRIHSLGNNSVFRGCVQVQEFEFFQRKFIDKATFEEFGENVVRRHFYAFN